MGFMSANPNATIDVAAIRKAYNLSVGDLARALSCARLTITRWEAGVVAPTGIYRATLQAMAAAAAETDELTRRANGALLASLGVAGLIEHKAFGPIMRKKAT